MNRNSWILVTIAASPGALATPPPNDECENAIPISGEGVFSFDSTEATASPQPPNDCDHTYLVSDDFEADVWFHWTPARTGYTQVSTCGATTVDTKIAIHDLDCSTLDAVLECDDDGCLYQSTVTFQAVLGRTYFIRIGAQVGLGGGQGEFRIARAETGFPVPVDPADLGCPGPASPDPREAIDTCNARDRWDAHNSTRTQFVVADEFVPEADGELTGVCWWGTYLRDGQECQRTLVDFFEITYYADDCGTPGEVIAGPFSQEDVTMDVIGPFETYESFPNGAFEYQYSAAHDPVQLRGGETYWISISNSYYNNCAWFWENALGPDGHALQIDDRSDSIEVIRTDLAFCVRMVESDAPVCFPAPPNDDCADAIALEEGETWFETNGATTDGPPNVLHIQVPDRRCYFGLSDEQVHKDIWYDVVPPCSSGLRLGTCDSSFDTKIALYEGADCPSEAPAVACNDDACGRELARQSEVRFDVKGGAAYKVRIGGFNGDWGPGVLTLEYGAPSRTSLETFAAFSNCLTGPCPAPPCPIPDLSCFAQDFDADADIDADDYARFHTLLTGP